MKLRVRIVPNARRDEVSGRGPDGVWRVRVQSPPVEGAANRGLVRLLADRLGVSKSSVRIAGGEHSREKIIEIDADESAVIRKMEGLES
jgi:uncharacterized protein